MPGSITSVNATFLLSIPPIFPIPIQLQRFGVDNIFAVDPVERSEIQMGVDGFMAAGFIYAPTKINITLAADSESNDVFDTWVAAENALEDTYRASGIIVLTSIGKKWNLVNGVLSTFPPMPDALKVLQPRKYAITWESVEPAPV